MIPESTPPISVVTPVYNGAKFIAGTVESVLRQNYRAFEYIVVDDGSSDETRSILSQFAKQINVVSHANIGEARTVNRGVELAGHDIVGIINSDDPVLPGLLDEVGQAFSSDPGLSALYPDWVWIDSNGSAVREVITHEFDLPKMLEQHLCIPGPGAFFRRSHIGHGPVRDPQYRSSADFDFWLRIGLRGKVRRLPRTLATWRQHSTSTSTALCNAEMARDKVRVIEGFFSRTDLPLEISCLQAQAMSAAYHNAGMLGLRATGIHAFKYFLKSYLSKPIWPQHILHSQRRSLPHMTYAATQPLSSRLHRAITPLLPRHYRHNAVVEQRFGVRDEP